VFLCGFFIPFPIYIRQYLVGCNAHRLFAWVLCDGIYLKVNAFLGWWFLVDSGAAFYCWQYLVGHFLKVSVMSLFTRHYFLFKANFIKHTGL